MIFLQVNLISRKREGEGAAFYQNFLVDLIVIGLAVLNNHKAYDHLSTICLSKAVNCIQCDNCNNLGKGYNLKTHGNQ